MTPDLPPPLDPAPPTAPGPAAGLGLVEFVRASRPAAAYVLLGLSALFLAGTVALASRSFKGSAPAEAAAVDPLNPDAPPPPPPDDPKKGDYTAGWVLALGGFVVTAGGGAFLLLGLPKPTVREQQAEARQLLLAVGGGLGFVLMAAGGWFFYRWLDSLTRWLDKGERKELLYVAVPFLLVVAGAGLVFAAVQPARAEERHNPLLRRLVYGTNFALTALLLVLALLAVNVFVALKVPAKLDTTETGFYTLADTTKAFLAKLPEPATLYVILPDSGEREVSDVRQFAYEAQDASNGKLTAKFVSPVTNKAELARLQEKYPRIGRDDEGVLVTAGEDEKRSAFVPYNDLFEVDQRARRVTGFAGEGRVLKELRFLADNEQKPVIYFTQGNGELALGGDRGAEAAAGGGAGKLKAFLEKAYLDVRPLVFPVQDPKVPDDAAAVVVAEPQTPFGEAAAGALKRYMTDRKGKLVVLAGATPGLAAKAAARTGLEPLLGDLNVRLGDKFLLTVPTNLTPDYRTVLTVFSRGSAQNPITQTLSKQYRGFNLVLPREVAALTTNPAFQATPLLVTPAGLPTWQDTELPADPEAAIEELMTSQPARVRRAYSEQPRAAAVVVSEGGTARALVVGNGFVFSDQVADRVRGGVLPSFDLLAAGLDWLRDRPALPTTVESKPYQAYQFPEPAAVDTTRLVWFPLGLALLVVTGLGAGVWVTRRK